MSYRLLADLVVVFHFTSVLFVIAGGALLVWRRRMAWVHLPAVAWVVFAECFHRTCPLTFLENWLRSRGSGETYQGDFVAHYVMPVLYPDGLTDRMQIVLGVGVLVINVTLYVIAFRRKTVKPPEVEAETAGMDLAHNSPAPHPSPGGRGAGCGHLFWQTRL